MPAEFKSPIFVDLEKYEQVAIAFGQESIKIRPNERNKIEFVSGLPLEFDFVICRGRIYRAKENSHKELGVDKSAGVLEGPDYPLAIRGLENGFKITTAGREAEYTVVIKKTNCQYLDIAGVLMRAVTGEWR